MHDFLSKFMSFGCQSDNSSDNSANKQFLLNIWSKKVKVLESFSAKCGL